MKVLHINDRDALNARFNGGDWQDDLARHGVESSGLVMLKSSKTDFARSVRRLDSNFTLSIMKDKRFLEADIIHLQLIHNTPFDIGYLPVMAALKPVVITLHDPFFLGGHCVYHFSCKKWCTVCHDCQYLDKHFKIDADDTALRFFIKKQAIQNSAVSAIAASEWMEEQVKRSPVWQGKSIYRLPFGVDETVFNPGDKKTARRMLNIDEDALVLMLRASDGPYKGLPLIKSALKEIKSDNYGKKIVLLVVDKKGLLKEFRRDHTIKEFGWITDSKSLTVLYQACDLLLMPSEQEAFGLMAVEAMACGRMVLSTRGTALEKTINSPDCGIVTEHNPREYTKELRRLLRSPGEIAERGEKSLEFANAHYRQSVFIGQLISVYNDVIKNHKSDENAATVIAQLLKYNSGYELQKMKVIKNYLRRLYYAIRYDLP